MHHPPLVEETKIAGKAHFLAEANQSRRDLLVLAREFIPARVHQQTQKYVWD